MMRAAALVCCAAHHALASGGGAFPRADLGPGAGPWIVGPPEQHGLSTASLEFGAVRAAELAPVRHCLVVATDGVVVHESYYGGRNSSSLVTIDSVGKTLTALIVGAAVTQGLLDIDRPIHSYGVKPAAGVDWGGYWLNVTTRHLLGQSSGQGKYPPGTAFTYDSGDYIGHLSPLLRAVTSMAPRAFALQLVRQVAAHPHRPPAYAACEPTVLGACSSLCCAAARARASVRLRGLPAGRADR